MAMDLNQAKVEVETAIKAAFQSKYPTGSDGSPTSPDDFTDIAESVSPGIIAALQHVLNNAETSVDGEDIL